MTRKQYSRKLIVMIIAAIALVWFIIPLFYQAFGIGSIVGAVFCLLVMAGAYLYYPMKEKYKKLENKRPAKIRWIVLISFFFACVLWAVILTGCMIFGANAAPPKDATVIVLGSQVKGTEPSLDLMQRISAASDYLKANPQAKCIVSGGQGKGEIVTEASAMRRYLVKNGIDSSRIFMEDTSTTTKENFANSLKIIKQKSLNKKVAVVTDEYHQFRAGVIARRTGLTPYSVPAHTPWCIFSACYARELLAITKAVVAS